MAARTAMSKNVHEKVTVHKIALHLFEYEYRDCGVDPSSNATEVTLRYYTTLGTFLSPN